MFFVVDYIDPEGVWSGLAYGDGAANEAFGLITEKGGRLAVQGWGSGNDFKSGQNGVTDGFMVQSVVLSDDGMSHYRNGDLIDSDTHVFNTDPAKLVLGGEIAGLGESEMAISAALIFDRALTDDERVEVETYLQHKYLSEDFLLA